MRRYFARGELGTSGCNYILVSFAWGSLTQAQSERSMELFVTRVMPQFGSASVSV